jgi:hypothetical protein
LLDDPGAAGIGGAACQVDAAAPELDEKEHVEAAQRERLDGQEIAGEHGGRLLAQEPPPARARTPRRRPRAGGEQDAPDRARRDTQAELEQFAGDPRVAPTWILAREAQDEFSHASVGRRTARSTPRLGPLCDARAPGASAGASGASPPGRGAGAAAADRRAPPATRAQLAAAGVAAPAVRARLAQSVVFARAREPNESRRLSRRYQGGQSNRRAFTRRTRILESLAFKNDKRA